jgi:hypothetical protein
LNSGLQDFLLAKQVLYHLSHSTLPVQLAEFLKLSITEDRPALVSIIS